MFQVGEVHSVPIPCPRCGAALGVVCEVVPFGLSGAWDATEASGCPHAEDLLSDQAFLMAVFEILDPGRI